MGAPQIIYLVILFCAMASKLALDGQKDTITHSFLTYFFTRLIIVGLLFWGGFFGG